MTQPVLDPVDLDARRILVVAPHPDDESLGCGGLLWHLARLGRRFAVAFVTDGGASHPNSPSWPRERLAAEREREADDALQRLGIGKAPRHFLRLRDADMPLAGTGEHEDALTAVGKIVKDFRPDLALLPWRRDPHRDHRDAWSLFMRGFDASGFVPQILEYAIWLDEIGAPDDHPRHGEMDRIGFDISEAVAAKRAAIEAHRTQTTALIDDDPGAFRLTSATIDRLSGPTEFYWRQPS